jgi:ABC-type lipoprotein export system ATPase subunit
VLMVTHDPAVAESCERTIHIRDGRIHEDVRR